MVVLKSAGVGVGLVRATPCVFFRRHRKTQPGGGGRGWQQAGQRRSGRGLGNHPRFAQQCTVSKSLHIPSPWLSPESHRGENKQGLPNIAEEQFSEFSRHTVVVMEMDWSSPTAPGSSLQISDLVACISSLRAQTLAHKYS